MKSNLVFVFLAILALLPGCALKEKLKEAAAEGLNMQSLVAKDGTRIAYDYWPGKEGMPGVVLVHMLPANRKSWYPFAKKLQQKGYHVIAIDYRGRGESEGKLERPEDYQNIALDLDAAIEFISKQKGVDNSRLAIIGASIGANHALLAGERHKGVKTVVLLSPGLDYRGVKTEETARRFEKPAFIAASAEDAYSHESSARLYSVLQGKKEFKAYRGAGHGTDMFKKEPELQELILKWLEENL